MAARPRVGVTGAPGRLSPSWWCTRLVLWWVGARAVRISVHHQAEADSLDALVIGGGEDIAPALYGDDTPLEAERDSARDHLEVAWIRWALSHQKPLLGICRGAQLINVVLGGDLHRDIRNLRRLTHNRPGLLPTKTVILEPESRLARLLGRSRLRVNSLHHQAIRQPGQGLRLVGHDRDQLVQAVEYAGQGAILGVQWHPEYLFYLPTQRALFRWLLSRAETPPRPEPAPGRRAGSRQSSERPPVAAGRR